MPHDTNGISVNGVHHGLKGGWRVSQTEEHNRGFEQAVACFEGRLMFVAFSDPNIVIPPSDVEFSVDMCNAEVEDKVGDKGEWVLVTNRELVDVSIVLYWL